MNATATRPTTDSTAETETPKAEEQNNRNFLVAWTLNATRAAKRAALKTGSVVATGAKAVGRVTMRTLFWLYAMLPAIYGFVYTGLSLYLGVIGFSLLLSAQPLLAGLYVLLTIIAMGYALFYGTKMLVWWIDDRNERREGHGSRYTAQTFAEAVVVPSA